MIRVPTRRFASAGITLIEMIVVIVILGVTMIAIISLQAQVNRGQSDNKDYELGVQLLQECAEKVLAVRRKSGYASVNASTCNTLPALSGYSASIAVSTPVSPTCLSGTTCQIMAVSVSNGTSTLGPVNIMLVNY